MIAIVGNDSGLCCSCYAPAPIPSLFFFFFVKHIVGHLNSKTTNHPLQYTFQPLMVVSHNTCILLDKKKSNCVPCYWCGRGVHPHQISVLAWYSDRACKMSVWFFSGEDKWPITILSVWSSSGYFFVTCIADPVTGCLPSFGAYIQPINTATAIYF